METLYFILLPGAGLILGVVLFYLLSRKHLRATATQLSELRRACDARLNETKAEVRRLEYMVADYRKKLRPESGQQAQIAPVSIRPAANDINDIFMEREALKAEKARFAEKNQRLWEQSLAVHREKERIDAMKNEIEARHNELRNSIRYAQRIQNAALPDYGVLEGQVKEYFIFWKPREIVSGDFYWFKVVDNKLVVAAVDCTGHGVPGAFMSMLGMAFLNEIVSEQRTTQPAEVLEEMRRSVKIALQQRGASQEQKDGMDMALCVLDLSTLGVQYAGAYNPMLWLHNGELNEIKATRSPIAIYHKERPFEQHSLQMQPGDSFYIFSDGFSDQFGGEKGDKFKIGRFREMILSLHTENLPMEEQGQRMQTIFDQWKGEHAQVDDVLVIGIRV